MPEAFQIGDPAIEIRLRRNARARRMVLRVSQGAAHPVLTLPPSVPVCRARVFALDHEDWLRRQLAAAAGRIAVRAGVVLPFRGGALTVLRSLDGRTGIRDGALHLPGKEALLATHAAAFLRETARQHCLAAAQTHAARLGRRVGRMTLRDPRARWGSCSAKGDLMFSWRLILAPDAVLDYVAAHEVAHLEELNHSPRFWAVVAVLCPDHAAPQEWLRRQGRKLMAFDFTPAA